MTLTHISNLLCPLTNAISFQSWEDAEDLAREISRLCRLKRLQEVQAIQEAVSLKMDAKVAPGASQVANSPPAGFDSELAFRPEPGITLDTRFDEAGHSEAWRNEVACELNWLVGLAKSRQRPYEIDYVAAAAVSIAKRVAEFEQIKTL